MTRELANLVAGMDDPAAIEDLLRLVSDGDSSNVAREESTTNPALDDLYSRFLARRQNRSPATRAQYKRTIPTFVDFATDNDVTTPAEITVELVDGYVDTLQDDYDNDSTILTYTKNVRAWLRWLNKREYCSEAVYRILDKDELGLTPTVRDEALPQARARPLLERLRQRRRGSLMHALLELLWNAGPRIGGVHSLDRRDFDPESNELRFRHRPETETRLKNGNDEDARDGDGERNVVVNDAVVRALSLYVRSERPDVTDESGREPLFATQYGRASRSTLRRAVYRATSCRWLSSASAGPSCDGSCDPDAAVCSASYYPHSIRRGAIVAHLSGGLRPHMASERFDVCVETIRKHYDPRTKRQRKNDRMDDVRDAWPE